LGKNQTFVPKNFLDLGFGFGYKYFLVLGLGFGFGYKNFWILGLGFGIGYKNFWVLGLGLGFGYNTQSKTQTQNPFFFLGTNVWKE